MNEYVKIGYIVKKNFINNKLLKKTLSEIELIKHNKDVDLYYDQKGLLRRVERIYDKGESLKKIDKKAKDLLREVFGFDFVIFKDKFNSKPQSGEGYYAHYDGIFKFVDHQNKIKNGWHEYGQTFVNLLISLDTMDDSNGALEIGNVQDKTFDELFLDTKKDGTPHLLPEKEKKLDFKIINLDVSMLFLARDSNFTYFMKSLFSFLKRLWCVVFWHNYVRDGRFMECRRCGHREVGPLENFNFDLK